MEPVKTMLMLSAPNHFPSLAISSGTGHKLWRIALHTPYYLPNSNLGEVALVTGLVRPCRAAVRKPGTVLTKTLALGYFSREWVESGTMELTTTILIVAPHEVQAV